MSNNEGVNSAAPTTAEIVGGVYNATPPVLEDGQAAALQLDVNGKLITSGSGGGGTDVNIVKIGGVPESLTNPLPVELSDGTQAVGTAGNPLSVNIITGGGSNASVGATGVTAPTSATEIGVIDGSGNLQGASSSNPVPITIAGSSLATSNMVGTTPGTAPADTSIVGQIYNATPPAPTDGQTLPLQSDASGNLKTTATISGTVTTQDAADGVDGTSAPTLSTQVSGKDALNNLQTLATDTSGQLFVGFQGQMMTVFQEILMELRATRRLMFLLYQESGEGDPTNDLLQDVGSEDTFKY